MTSPAALNILVVDDYGNMRLMLKNMLRQLGFRDVYTAEDGGSALNQLRERAYRLIISDWNMTPISGLELLQTIRRTSAMCQIPFIMVTGNKDAATHAMELGAGAAIVKPFSMADLKGAVTRALAGG